LGSRRRAGRNRDIDVGSAIQLETCQQRKDGERQDPNLFRSFHFPLLPEGHVGFSTTWHEYTPPCIKSNRPQVGNALKLKADLFVSISTNYGTILSHSLGIAKELDIYAYDAFMLEVAFRHKAPLITLDNGLLHAARKKGINTIRVR
jgi:hypothetical protein